MPQGNPAASTSPLVPYSLGDLEGLHRFDDLSLGGQPLPLEFERMAQEGLRSVIDLRNDLERQDFKESELLEGLGVQYQQVWFRTPTEMSDGVLRRAREALNTAERPALLHCGSGHRVGVVWAVWRHMDGGIPLDQALEEARTIGMKNDDFLPRIEEYIAAEKAAAEAAGG